MDFVAYLHSKNIAEIYNYLIIAIRVVLMDKLVRIKLLYMLDQLLLDHILRSNSPTDCRIPTLAMMSNLRMIHLFGRIQYFRYYIHQIPCSYHT